MKDTYISDSIKYVGVDDRDIDLFESQYIVPNGVSYNAYVILDEKVCVMDTVDKGKTEEWLGNLKKELGDRKPDYLVIHHLEPDHAGSIADFVKEYPESVLVGTEKMFSMLPQFFDFEFEHKMQVVAEGDTLSLGGHTLTFIMAPMVHWPEVMVSYESSEKILFSADGFGKFGALDTEEDWACEARRYYFNIVGKYGAQVTALLKKASSLDIKMICPLHGPILKENLSYYIGLYETWSSYKPEVDGVFIAYASIHGNTAKVAKYFKDVLEQKGAKKVAISDLSREDIAECVEDAFKYGKVVLAASSYDAGVFAPMSDFLHHLKSKAWQNRDVAIIENGSWGPTAAKTIKSVLETMKDIRVCDTVITIRSTMKETDKPKLSALADELLSK